MASTPDNAAVLVGVLVALLFYTCFVLSCVKLFQCKWVVEDYEYEEDAIETLIEPDGIMMQTLCPACTLANNTADDPDDLVYGHNIPTSPSANGPQHV